jgi:NO-binding membrane sensor protein with MHYT domain
MRTFTALVTLSINIMFFFGLLDHTAAIPGTYELLGLNLGALIAILMSVSREGP